MRVLVVDDEESVLRAVRRTLRAYGFLDVHTVACGREALQVMRDCPAALLLLDLAMPGIGGLEVLKTLRADDSEVPVIVVTAKQEMEAAVDCIRHGAEDYLVKPVPPERLFTTIENALRRDQLRTECDRLRVGFFDSGPRHLSAFEEILTEDPEMLRVFSFVEAIAVGSHPVLIWGETGTGKELIARALHEASGRSGPFLSVNVGGLDDAMFSDTLFGHTKGAFTGAGIGRQGLLAAAGEGTLFLDEIGELEKSTQVKLLRVLQERDYYPLGTDRPREVRCRIVTATNRDPQSLREDLYYRLRGCNVRVPPLRERLADLPLLVERFLKDAAVDLGREVPGVPQELFVHLADQRFPGNVRELQALVLHAVARNDHPVIPLRMFLDQFADQGTAREERSERGSAIQFPSPMPSLRSIEEAAVAETLLRVQGNQSAAARMLEVSRPTIGRHARRLKAGPESS